MCILYPSPSGWAWRMPDNLWPLRVLHTYMSTIHTHTDKRTRLRGKHAETDAPAHTCHTCTQTYMLACTYTHSKRMTHSRGWIVWGSTEDEHRGNSSLYAKYAADTQLNMAHGRQSAIWENSLQRIIACGSHAWSNKLTNILKRHIPLP